MTKKIIVDGKEMTMRASALIPRLYRYHFKRYIIQDMQALEKAFKKAQEEGEPLKAVDLTIFENVAWLFLKQGGEEVGESPDEWLDSLEGMFSIYQVFPDMMELWQANLQTTAIPKKK